VIDNEVIVIVQMLGVPKDKISKCILGYIEITNKDLEWKENIMK
jgi:hypothetical protein